MDCSPPDSSVHGIFQARVLEWGAIAFSVQTAYIMKKEQPCSKLASEDLTVYKPRRKERDQETVTSLVKGLIMSG